MSTIETVADLLATLKAACEARGCHLGDQFSVMKLRYELVHWQHGQDTDDHRLTLAEPDLALVRAWLENIHR